mgnify:CR=1 FL=1
MDKLRRMSKIRTYSELSLYDSFEDRYEYLKLSGSVGFDTFGFDRVFNQMFYNSREWKLVRDYVITRDHGCDLGCLDQPIHQGIKIIVHHMNPIEIDDIKESKDIILEPEFLITTIQLTHNRIHYGIKDPYRDLPDSRFENDTCPWKR